MLRSALCGLVAAMLGRSHGLFFELRDAGASECFKANPGHGHRLIGSYEADGPTEGISVKVIDPNTRELWHSKETAGRFDVEAMDEGQHKLCFSSSIAEPQMVSFNFHVDEHGDGEVPSSGHKDFVTKEHTDKVGELVAKLEIKSNDILDQQQYAITREAVHRETAESTNSRVMWWTLLEVAVLISLATFQVYYLRSYFEMKQVV